MAKQRIPAIPKFTVNTRARRVYGIEFTSRGSHELISKIAEASGMESVNVIRILVDKGMHAVAAHQRQSYSETFYDDAVVYVSREFGIDPASVEHNVEKLDIDAFVDRARTYLTSLALPASEIRMAAFRSQLWNLWREWIEHECVAHGCEQETHSRCDEYYARPDMDAILAHVAQHNAGRAKLLKSIDAKPKGKAIKIANDALARIAVSGRAKGAST